MNNDTEKCWSGNFTVKFPTTAVTKDTIYIYYNKLWRNLHFYTWANPFFVNTWFYVFIELLEMSYNETIIVGQQLQYQWKRYVQQYGIII